MPKVLKRSSEEWHDKLFQNIERIKNEYENSLCLSFSKEKKTFSKTDYFLSNKLKILIKVLKKIEVISKIRLILY